MIRVLVATVLIFSANFGALAGNHGENAIIGKIRYHRIEPGETLVDLARRFNLGYVALVAANPNVDPWLPKVGTRLVLPTAHLLPDAPHKGIVVNLAEQRLYFFAPENGEVSTYPVGIGRAEAETRLGESRIKGKQANPTWYPPESMRRDNPNLPGSVPPGPANPLGKFAIFLDWPEYVIHGTNKPRGVGRRVSHGCVRLYPEGIADLFEKVRPGMPVRIIDQQAKLGWSNGQLYLEVHPAQSDADALEAQTPFKPRPIPELKFRVVRAAGDAADRIDWAAVQRISKDRRGIPEPILTLKAR